jgi:hypothetical protein
MTKEEALRHAFLSDSLTAALNTIERLSFEVRASGSLKESTRNMLLGVIEQNARAQVLRETQLRKQLND